jgi:hypothetical protein
MMRLPWPGGGIGRRSGFKIPWPKGHTGSIPVLASLLLYDFGPQLPFNLVGSPIFLENNFRKQGEKELTLRVNGAV